MSTDEPSAYSHCPRCGEPLEPGTSGFCWNCGWPADQASNAKVTATDGSVSYLHYVTPGERQAAALERIAAALEKLTGTETPLQTYMTGDARP